MATAVSAAVSLCLPPNPLLLQLEPPFLHQKGSLSRIAFNKYYQVPLYLRNVPTSSAELVPIRAWVTTNAPATVKKISKKQDEDVVVNKYRPKDLYIGRCLLNTKIAAGCALGQTWRAVFSTADFYSANPNYKTRILLQTRNAETVFDVNSAVLDLLKNEVDGIVWPHNTTQETFVAKAGDKAHIPIISFTASGSTLSYSDSHYFVRAKIDDAIQAQALAAICNGFGWPSVAVFYEDTEYGSQFLSPISKAFQEVETGIEYTTAIPTSIENGDLSKKLKRLTTKQTRIFLVHMNPSLGHRFFTHAKRAGVMSEGYAWIISDSLSNFMSSIDSNSRDLMEGVLGVRPYIRRSNELESFQKRWKRNTVLDMELNVFGLWAYDAITALVFILQALISPHNFLFPIGFFYLLGLITIALLFRFLF